MTELLPRLIPLLVVDVLNPVLFALLVVAVSTTRPIANSTAFLAGHTASYFISGIIIALGLNQITDRLNNPLPVDFVIELLIGLLLLWAALASRDGKASADRTPDRELTPAYCFGYGAVVNFIGVPFALPYFAAVDQLLKADLSLESSLLVLAFYNMAYVLPFLLVPILVALTGDSSKPILEKINNLLISLVDKFMPILLLLLGLALTADALSYLISGETLW
jgi:cytochrome c biogenesis protein CcdA